MELTQLKDYKSKRPVSLEKRQRVQSEIFKSDELTRMIDENIEEVRRIGYAKLVVPPNLHSIDNNRLPKNVKFVSDTLINAGFKAYLCGGTVRDLVLGEVVNDFDFVTNAANDDLEKLFEGIHFFEIPTGHRLAYLDFGDEVIDVATMVNIPSEYHGKDGVPEFDPASLYSDSPLFDAFQRDLTFNAMYYDTETCEVIDYLAGLYCLREGIIKTPCHARDTFDYDPRRVIRAIRFACRFGFVLSGDMDEELRARGSDYIRRIKPRDMRSLLPRLFNSGFSRHSAEMLMDYNLFGEVFPPVKEKMTNPHYVDYALHTSRAADWLFDEGTWALPIVVMAAFLWPAIKDARNAGCINPLSHVWELQQTVLSMFDEEEEFFKEILLMETDESDRSHIKKELIEIFEKPDFKDGLKVLHLYYMENRHKL